jgi:hypothetical protein
VLKISWTTDVANTLPAVDIFVTKPCEDNVAVMMLVNLVPPVAVASQVP